MAKYLGNALLLKVESTPGSGDWQIVGGSSSHTLSISSEVVDTSDKDSNRWKESLNAGTRMASISMEGFVSDNAYFAVMETAAKDDVILNYLLEFGDSKVVNGAFHIDSLEQNGAQNTAQEFSTTISTSDAAVIGALTDFLLDESDLNLLDENNQYIQGS